MTPHQLYECMALRQKVFVVEQRAPYVDADGVDPVCWHLMCWNERHELVGYVRVVPAGIKYEECSFGRVVNALEVRGKGIGRAMVAEAMKKIDQVYGHVSVRISAQAYLKDFYGSFGFKATADETYLEDGIPHYDMLRAGIQVS